MSAGFLPAQLFSAFIRDSSVALVVDTLLQAGNLLAEQSHSSAARSLTAPLFVLKNTQNFAREQEARARLQTIVSGFSDDQWRLLLNNRSLLHSVQRFIPRKLALDRQSLPLDISEHPLGGIVRRDSHAPGYGRILLAVQYGAPEDRVVGLTAGGARLEVHLRQEDDRLSLSRFLGQSIPVFPVIKGRLKRISFLVPLPQAVAVLDSLNSLGPRVVNREIVGNLAVTMNAGSYSFRGMELAWEQVKKALVPQVDGLTAEEKDLLKQMQAFYVDAKRKMERLKSLWKQGPLLMESLPEFNRLVLDVFSITGCFETILFQYYNTPRVPRVSRQIPEKEYRELYDLYAILRGLAVPTGPDSPSVLRQRLEEMGRTLSEMQKEIEGDMAFGSEREFWPGALRQPFEILLKFAENAAAADEEVTRLVTAIQEKMKSDASSSGEIRPLLKRGLFLAGNFLGVLPGDMQERLNKIHLKLKLDPNKIGRWEKQVERLRLHLAQERAKPFVITPSILDIFNWTRRTWKTQFLRPLKVGLRKIGRPGQVFLEDIGALRAARLQFCSAYELFYAARDAAVEEGLRGSGLDLNLKPSFYRLRGAENKLRALGDKTANALVLLQGSREPKPQKSHKKSLAGGDGFIDGVPIELRGSCKTQDAKLQRIASLLKIDDAELLDSVALAHPFLKALVQKRMREGKPLRKLLKVNEGNGVAVIYDYRFGSAFYVPWKDGWILDKAKSFVPLFHGAGGSRSTGATMQAAMIRLRSLRHSAITFDTPNHGYGLKDKRFHQLSEFTGWVDCLIDYFRYLRDHSKMVPIIPIGRSHGENAIVQFAVNHPGKVDGLVGISGYDPAWDAQTFPHIVARIGKPGREGFTPHPKGLPMVADHDGVQAAVAGVLLGGDHEEEIVVPDLSQVTIQLGERGAPQWTFLDPASDPLLESIPTLHFSGTEDDDYRPVDRFWEERRRWAARLPGRHEMVVIDGGGHDLLSLGGTKPSPEEKARTAEVYSRVDAFLSSIVADFSRNVTYN